MSTLYTSGQLAIICNFFSPDGYVFNFSTDQFDSFTSESIGVPLCTKYRMSKGKSLRAYLAEASDKDQTKLISDLIRYYEDLFGEEDKKAIDGFQEERYSSYLKAKRIIDLVTGQNHQLNVSAEKLKNEFSSEYLTKEIDLMMQSKSHHPTEAIGKSKELIESCCKTILDRKSIPYLKTWNLQVLVKTTLQVLELTPNDAKEEDRYLDSVKKLLGNLKSIPTAIGEIRNPYGSGHGKSAGFIPLPEKYATLAVASSIAFVEFVWETYLEKADQFPGYGY